MRVQSSLFKDRADAGRKLANLLQRFSDEHPAVLGLARGGVLVAAEVAERLNAPLDVMVSRKIGAPLQPELGIGAVAPGGVRVVDERLVQELRITDTELEKLSDREREEVDRRIFEYRRGRPPLSLRDRTVILVDDGLATGVTALAAVRSLRKQQPRKLILAFPVCSSQGKKLLAPEADEIVCDAVPQDLYAVGAWYDDFSQTTDQEVAQSLSEASRRHSGATITPVEVARREVEIDIQEATLHADLAIPQNATGIVLFAHGSGSSRLSPRNRFVATRLNEAGLATLLADLLTQSEEVEDRYSGHLRFDIGLLSDRLYRLTGWIKRDPDIGSLPIGYFGASTGAAAALAASVIKPGDAKAIVSRGGRPDLAGGALHDVTAATLLIVGTHDEPVIALNEDALQELCCPTKDLQLVEGATHLFEEPGALEQVAELAADWFSRYLK